jgi:hypothetical protein
MENYVVTILMGIIVTVISGLMVWGWRDLSSRVRKNEQEIAKTKEEWAKSLKEDIRHILEEYLNKFELMLINEGRIPPRHHTKRKSSNGRNKDE